mmetsp:Transcript_54145/g.156368  ORF Transcript_54145/g.156368 Transcript_54145/m.156368 type:complete len:218 (+) Transcript_54145:630-1283(+)
MQCIALSARDGGVSLSSSTPPFTRMASRNCEAQFAWPTLDLSQLERNKVCKWSTRSRVSSSASMVTVRMCLCEPPSLFGSNFAPPVGLDKMIRNLSAVLYLATALMVTGMFACTCCGKNSSSPSLPSNSTPLRAVSSSSWYSTVTWPQLPCILCTEICNSMSWDPCVTVMVSSVKQRMPGSSSSMMTTVARGFAPNFPTRPSHVGSESSTKNSSSSS